MAHAEISFPELRHSSTNWNPPHSQAVRQGGVRSPSQKSSPARSHRMSRGATWERSSASTRRSALRSCEARTDPGTSEARAGRSAHRRVSGGAARRRRPCARLCSSVDRLPTAIGRRRQPARHSSNASLRSATTLASAAFSNWSTPIGTVVQRDCGRSRWTRRCGTQKSSSNL